MALEPSTGADPVPGGYRPPVIAGLRGPSLKLSGGSGEGQKVARRLAPSLLPSFGAIRMSPQQPLSPKSDRQDIGGHLQTFQTRPAA